MAGIGMGGAAAANPYAAAFGAAASAATGGPSSAESGGDDQVNIGAVNIGGNGRTSIPTSGTVLGVTPIIWAGLAIGAVIITAVVIYKS